MIILDMLHSVPASAQYGVGLTVGDPVCETPYSVYLSWGDSYPNPLVTLKLAIRENC